MDRPLTLWAKLLLRLGLVLLAVGILPALLVKYVFTGFDALIPALLLFSAAPLGGLEFRLHWPGAVEVVFDRVLVTSWPLGATGPLLAIPAAPGATLTLKATDGAGNASPDVVLALPTPTATPTPPPTIPVPTATATPLLPPRLWLPLIQRRATP